MPTLDATVGGSSANSYIDVSTADTLADERLQTAEWTAAGTDDKERALIMATRRLEQLRYEGDKTDSSQALKWPRQDAVDENGDEYATDAIPALVQEQVFEVALWVLNQDADGTDPMAPTGLEGFRSAKVGPMEVERDRSFSAGDLPDNVLRALRPVRKSSGLMVPLVRG